MNVHITTSLKNKIFAKIVLDNETGFLKGSRATLVFQSFQTKQVAKRCGIEAHRWEVSVCLGGSVCRFPVSPQHHGGVAMRVLPSELKNTRGSPKCRRLGRNLCKRAGSGRAVPQALGTQVTQL